ncbi:hypothetical protein ROLI_013520 [Roseobacter fucihabitans]|uniref:PhzF family phenazine biosynthesis protein n=1 Tax=Roseobacter fucihabitans TaxID=1537242 RepID=A0ABZ2BQQ5_9RHOB|nr:PhzF family phenazine biosynthesis isomerase [Roseobacter litoralis]MBC6967025.1 putative isomerase YddE [Roseobacter litoralis]
MARIAAEVGYSETAFAVPAKDNGWRVRYFSPESEVPFCGHASIALGAALGQRQGAGIFALKLNDAEITVEARESSDGMTVTLASPSKHSSQASAEECDDALALLGFTRVDLDDRLPPARIQGGADHFVLALKDRARLAVMAYDLDVGRKVMRQHALVTIMLVHIADDQLFDGVTRLPLVGLSKAPRTVLPPPVFAGYLRDAGWPHGSAFTIRQGDDMGAPSNIYVALSDTLGSSIRVFGTACHITL